MADEQVTEPTFDEQLEALLGGTSAPAEKPAASAPLKAGEQPAAASPQAAQDQTPVDPLEAALDALGEKPAETPGEKPAEKPADKAPELSTEQQTILKHIPDVETAVDLHQTKSNYDNFTAAFQGGHYENVVQMFEKWDAGAFEGFLEHIYAQNIDAWTDRWVAEKEGRGTEHKKVMELQRQVRQLASQKQAPQQQAKAQPQAQQQAVDPVAIQKSFTDYTTYVDGLFDKIKFNAEDRPYVRAALNEAVVKDQNLLNAIRNGKPAEVVELFKTTVRAYVNRDKQVKDGEAAKLALQGQKKPALGGGTATVQTGELPSDIKQVKKGDEDKWLDQELTKLFGKK